MQPDRHHLRAARVPLGIERIEGVAQVALEIRSPVLKPCGVAKRMSLASSV
jgi:hypothetical protein